MDRKIDKRRIAGWAAVGFSTVITCVWAFWGIIENFHEGWYSESIFSNLGLMFAQYLSPMLIFMGATLVAIFWPRLGGGLHILIAILAAGFFQVASNAAILLIILPLIGLGLLYWFGRAHPHRLAASLAVGFPLLTLIIAGISPAIRVAQRLDDGDVGARVVSGNGVELVWAPEGPGWPRSGVDWAEAVESCRALNEDGRSLATEPQLIWHLPSADEAVRSMARHGENSGGLWDADAANASYETTPDKESPLWNVHSPIIYWWTASEVDEARAYMIAYDGQVWPRSKDLSMGSLGFRCVR